MEHDLKPPVEPQNEATAELQKAGTNSHKKLWVLTAVVLVLLVLVLWILPAMVNSPGKVQETTSSQEQEPVVARAAADTTANQQRKDAEQALQVFLHLQAEPDLNNAVAWANSDWQAALDTAAEGDKSFGQGQFATALQTYQSAGEQLQTILDNRDNTLQETLQSAWDYLQANEVEDASAAFESVIAMQSDHQQAQLGLERAAVREQVLEFVTQARQFEVTNNLPLAKSAYTSATTLDPLYSLAQVALEKVELELRERAFQDAMGKALQAIDKGEFATAEQALTYASGIHPENDAVRDAQRRLVTERRKASLNSLRQQAEQLESQEDWTSAVVKYKQALSIDSKAAFASNGLPRVQKKQRLHAQLDHYLADMTQLYSDEPLDNAQKLLTANQSPPASEPLLSGKLEKLQQAITLAVTPIDLLLVSDNLTDITIYKVGHFGTFAQKQFSLRPGKYTVLGTRQGYRDVLKVIELKPATKGQSMEIRSEEKI